MKNIIFSKSAPVFALFAIMATYLQMYAKLYYYNNAYPTGFFILDVSISLVAGLGLCTVTLIIIIHSRNRSTPIYFTIIDFALGAVFFSENLKPALIEGDVLAIAVILLIPLIKSSAIFFLSEIFLRYHSENEAEKTEINEIADLKNKLALMENEKQRTEADLIYSLAMKQEAEANLQQSETEKQQKETELQQSKTEQQQTETELQQKITELQQTAESEKQLLLLFKEAFPTEIIAKTKNRLSETDTRFEKLNQIIQQLN